MTIELVQPFFDYGTDRGRKLVAEFRRRLFEEVAKSETEGLIFTYAWALDHPEDRSEIEGFLKIFEQARVSFVELSADLDVRLERNRSALRLQHKASKRHLELSESRLLADEAKYQMNSDQGFFFPERHLKINNSLTSPDVVAKQIVTHFGFTPKISRPAGR